MKYYKNTVTNEIKTEDILLHKEFETNEWVKIDYLLKFNGYGIIDENGSYYKVSDVENADGLIRYDGYGFVNNDGLYYMASKVDAQNKKSKKEKK